MWQDHVEVIGLTWCKVDILVVGTLIVPRVPSMGRFCRGSFLGFFVLCKYVGAEVCFCCCYCRLLEMFMLLNVNY